jgi:hypothetical protein
MIEHAMASSRNWSNRHSHPAISTPPTRIDNVFDAHRSAPQSAMERKAMATAEIIITHFMLQI